MGPVVTRSCCRDSNGVEGPEWWGAAGRVENLFGDYQDDGDSMGEWCHLRRRCCMGSGVFWSVASVSLKGLAALSPAAIFFNTVLISWFLQNLSVLTFQFCSPPGHPSTIYIKLKSPFLNIFPSSSGSHWDKIQVMIWRHGCIGAHAGPCLSLFGFISLLIEKLYSTTLSSNMCDIACSKGFNDDSHISNIKNWLSGSFFLLSGSF